MWSGVADDLFKCHLEKSDLAQQLPESILRQQRLNSPTIKLNKNHLHLTGTVQLIKNNSQDRPVINTFRFTLIDLMAVVSLAQVE